jgi:Icc protein
MKMNASESHTASLSRRGLLKASAAGLLVAATAGVAGAKPAAAPAAAAPGGKRSRSLRIAHLTDIHIQPELAAAEGLAQCFKHLSAQADKAQLVVTGGDLIMDSFAADETRTALQWELLTKTIKDNTGLRVEHTLGNHDIWGWNKSKSKTTGSEKLWGKQRAIETLGMKRSYHSYDLGGWHFVHIDSVQPDPSDANGYIGKVDAEQMDWLKSDLAAVKPGTNTLVISHIPIFSATAMVGKREKDGSLKIAAGLMHTDSNELRELFEKSGHVRAAISGHTHRLDRLDFRGIRYCCNGAVSGGWWKGPNAEAAEGYTLIDLFDDGTVECQYTPYGWQARK